MAKYKSQYFDDANITTAALGAFLTAAGWEFTVEGDVTTIALSNKVSLVITKSTAGYNNFKFDAVVNGVTTTIRTVSRYFNMVSCKSANAAFLECYGDNNGNCLAFLWEKTGSQELCGYTGNNAGAVYIPITDINLTDVDTSEVYNHGSLLNYAAQSGSIDYCDNDALFLSGVKTLNDPNFKACSTMTANTVITVQGSNHFVIGAHSLFEYDN